MNITLTNQEFLEALAGDDWRRVPISWGGKDWTAHPAGKHLAKRKPLDVNYFTCSIFALAADGRFRRTKELFQRQFVFVIDDVGTKINADALRATMPPATYELETSPGNRHLGYKLNGATDARALEALVDAIISDPDINPSLMDPGMKAVTRVMRLPVGASLKPEVVAKNGGKPWPNFLHVWRPEIAYSIEDLAFWLGVDLGEDALVKFKDVAGARRATAGELEADPILKLFDMKEMLLDATPNDNGFVQIICPWAAEHSDSRNEAGYKPGSGGFQCHHGHCESRNMNDLRAWMAENVTPAEQAAALAETFGEVDSNDPMLLAEVARAKARHNARAKKMENDDVFVTLGGSQKRVVTVEDVDARFGQLEAPGLPTTYVYRPDSMPITADDLHKRLGGEVVVSGADKDGVPRYAPAAQAWRDYARRHRYRKIVFMNEPNLPADKLNLFRGLGVVPKAGDCSKIINHVFEVLASEDWGVGGFLIKLCAWQLQNIGRPSRVIVILKSEQQQVGKGLLLNEVLCPIFGPSSFVTANMEQVTGRFNYHLSGKSLVFLDEVLFGGDRKAGDAIKMLSTAATIGLEPKGVGIIQSPVAFNFWLCSNHKSAAHIEKTDARYVVLDVSPHRFGDRAYFDALMQEINNGGREAFAHYLLNLDHDGVVPSADMHKSTAAKRSMQWESVNPYDARKWLEACCHTGVILGSEQGRRGPRHWIAGEPIQWIAESEISFADLLRSYTEWQKSVRSPVSPQPTKAGAFGPLLSRVGFAARSTGTERMRILPPCDECLEMLPEN